MDSDSTDSEDETREESSATGMQGDSTKGQRGLSAFPNRAATDTAARKRRSPSSPVDQKRERADELRCKRPLDLG
ncbi:hypothetical protein RvY_02394 [Ramazzottius varieornatus]|uniref:Uncharacterized protein n=1 Tax=Ramazzottius varieornatus TaxID=947166 RepID=A0A1D1UJK9_RAMVA|nr:hypothetical protein RvY_02394 [Ramazzottius varieornatus]